MSNNRDALSPISRAVVAGALVGTTTSCIEQWRRYQRGETTLNESAVKVASDAAKAGVVSGTVMGRGQRQRGAAFADWLTLASAGIASLYVLDAMQRRESLQDQTQEGVQE